MTLNNQQILTKRLCIRILERSDLLGLMPILSDPLVTRHIPYEPWKSELDAQAWYQKTVARIADGRASQYIIERREDNALIGACLYFNHDVSNASAEFGYVLGQAHWKQGYMLEAMSVFVEHLIAKLELTTLKATVETPNAASIKLLAKLDFNKCRQIIEGGAELQEFEKHFIV